MPSLPVFAYLNGIFKTRRYDIGHVSMTAEAENLLMTLLCFFKACCDCHSSHKVWYSQTDCHQGGLNMTLQAGFRLTSICLASMKSFDKPASIFSKIFSR